MKHITIKNVFLMSVSILTISSAVAMDYSDDLVPNKVVNGTSGRVVTGISYSIYNPTYKEWLFVSNDKMDSDHIVESHPSKYEERNKFVFEDAGGQYKIYNPTYKEWLFVSNDKMDSDHIVGSHPSKYEERNEFEFIPENYKLYAVIKDFNYGGVDLGNLFSSAQSVNSSVSERTVTNNSGQPVLKTETFTQEENLSYRWSFTKSNSTKISNSVSVQVNYSPPSLTGGIGGGIGYNFGHETVNSFSEENTHSKSKTTSHSDVTQYTIAPYKGMKITTIRADKVAPVQQFTARVLFTAKADRLRTNGSTRSMVDVDAEGVECLLKNQGYKAIVQVADTNAVFATVQGTLQANYSVSSVTLNEYNL